MIYCLCQTNLTTKLVNIVEDLRISGIDLLRYHSYLNIANFAILYTCLWYITYCLISLFCTHVWGISSPVWFRYSVHMFEVYHLLSDFGILYTCVKCITLGILCTCLRYLIYHLPDNILQWMKTIGFVHYRFRLLREVLSTNDFPRKDVYDKGTLDNKWIKRFVSLPHRVDPVVGIWWCDVLFHSY